MRFLMIIVMIILVLLSIVYINIKHFINIVYITEVEGHVENDYYGIIYSEDELWNFEKNNGVNICISDGFNFKQNALLVCGGHKIVKGYYKITDEDRLFSDSHFLYVVVDKNKDNKIYIYSISNKYRSWFYSQRYYEGFNGIEYE